MDSPIHQLLSAIKTPTDFTTLLSLLSTPLDALGLLPPRYRHLLPEKNTSLSDLNLRKYIPQIQHALLTNILPTWDTLLQENQASLLVEQYFCPDVVYNIRPVAGEIALCGYATLVSFTPLPEQALVLLQRLVREYPLDRLFFCVFGGNAGEVERVKKGVRWEDCVRNLCMVPAKVANAFAGKTPTVLENAVYFNGLSVRTEELIFSLSSSSSHSFDILTALSYLFTKVVNTGLFPARPPTARSQPSFFVSTLPHIRGRLTEKSYTKLWSAILLNLPTLTLQSILTSLFSSLSNVQLILDGTPPTRALIKREAELLKGLVGGMTPSPEREELWEIASGVILNMNMDWNESHARIFVCWIASGGSKALDAFLDVVLETWSSSEYVKHSLLSRHKYTTALFLLTISYLTPSSPSIQSLVTSSSFVRSITTYISHNDHSVRRCGMLVAEEIARLTQKKLEFAGWEGDANDILKWARDVRQLTRARDVDADLEAFQEEEKEDGKSHAEEVVMQTTSTETGSQTTPNWATSPPQRSEDYDSDDSLTGYASPPSSRSSSPDPKELEEIARDPTLNVVAKKVPRPVYLAQLGELLRGNPGLSAQKPDEPHEADRIEMALNVAEELLRKKKGYGTELDENAINLAYAFLALNDKYDSEGFSEKRQGAMNALIACAPKKAAPALIEEFFKNQYSADQRFVALNALAIGARELASLPIPPSLVPAERTVFPSKMLSAPLHNKYMVAEKKPRTGVIPLLMDEISNQALNDERSTAEHHPEISRERRFRIQKPSLIKEIAPHEPLNPYSRLSKPIQLHVPLTKFVDVAAEFFIVPLVNRFWTFLRDEQAREERSSFREGRDRYRGAGTGMILNSVVLAQFLRTLGILVHASQNAPEWLAIIAPNALEVAVTIGTRPISHLEVEEDELEEISDEKERKEASVLTAALEVALVVLNGALEIDGGKILGLEHTTLVLAIGEWAGKVFASLEKGLKVPGGGGLHEAKLSRATAGVLLKVDELASKWRRSMLDTR